MNTQFDSSKFDDKDRLSYWHEVIGRLFCRATGKRVDDMPFSANLNQNFIGKVEVSDIQCNAMRYNRVSQDLRIDQSEDFLLSMMLEGSAEITQGGRIASQDCGDLVLYNAAQPFIYDFPKPYRMLLAKIPRAMLSSRLRNADGLTAVRVSCTSPLGSLAGSMMRSVASISLPKSDAVSAKVGSSLVDILAAAIEFESANQSDFLNRHSNLLKRAKTYIKNNLEDSELDVDKIANAVYVSSRTLSRAFASEGTTVMKWLWQERLQTGYALLSEGGAGLVTDVAFGCGFTSGSHFSRLFKSSFGVLPNSLIKSIS
jgi:AraC family transcriptional regulator, positive regulator of tynA and feaB